MVVYTKDSIPLAWNNYALFRFGELTQAETIEAALQSIVVALGSLGGKKPKMTPSAAIMLGQMFIVAIDAACFELSEQNKYPQSTAYDLVTDAEAITLLMQVFTDSMPIEQKKK